MKAKLLFFVGIGDAVKRSLVELNLNYPEITPVVCTYGRFAHWVKNAWRLKLTPGLELEQVKAFVQERQVVGVVNRFDNMIPLAGILIDYFGVPGSGYASVMKFRNKAEMHRLMLELGFGKHRPNTMILKPEMLRKTLQITQLPKIVKPSIGSKSRGVYLVTNQQSALRAQKRLQRHFEEAKLYIHENHEDFILVEDVIEGKQVSVTCYVDSRGKLRVLGFVEIWTGRDLGQLHQQLVFRTTEARITRSQKQIVLMILERLIAASQLRSTFLHPEFIIKDNRVYVVEVNVRIGGFRTKMHQLSQGIDLDQRAIELALGRDRLFKPNKALSCTAVEVWDERSGIIKQLSIPDDSRVKQLKVTFNVGDTYKAPPKGDKPLASFYVLSQSNSLEAAQVIRRDCKIRIQK